MKNQALFSSKDKIIKEIKMSSEEFLFGALRINTCTYLA